MMNLLVIIGVVFAADLCLTNENFTEIVFARSGMQCGLTGGDWSTPVIKNGREPELIHTVETVLIPTVKEGPKPQPKQKPVQPAKNMNQKKQQKTGNVPKVDMNNIGTVFQIENEILI